MKTTASEGRIPVSPWLTAYDPLALNIDVCKTDIHSLSLYHIKGEVVLLHDHIFLIGGG